MYLAPELLKKVGGTSVDWWCLGILLHKMLTGRTPWPSETPEDILRELRKDSGPINLSVPQHLGTTANASTRKPLLAHQPGGSKPAFPAPAGLAHCCQPTGAGTHSWSCARRGRRAPTAL